MKKLSIVLVLAFGLTLIVVWLWPPAVYVESVESEDGYQLKFKAEGTHVQMYADGRWQPFFAQGVNMGAAMPGHFPGELSISMEDYMRWFGMIQEMGANVVRVYTILKPEFYEALVKYNAQREEDPLYFMQGVWSPEERLNEIRDAFDPELKKEFAQEIRDAVGAVYGTADIKYVPHSGKASGTYVYNAGPYLLGWIIGTEWDPRMVERTNDLHADLPDYEGAHFRSGPAAHAFEKWLSEMMDITAQAEREHGWQHPIAFSNWVTTDPLEHPGEPLIEEDLVSVDPLHVEVHDWEAGMFASYHVYPYYPDFFTYDETFQTLENERGEIDSFKSYLVQLRDYHRELPIMITEFGVPTSQGVAHLGPLGRHQGGHSEQEQGAINAELFRLIHQSGYSGAILFTWQDEWFKKTWNTLHYDIPDRRAYWYNALTNESFFGVLGMYPSKNETILIDGNPLDWEALQDKQRLDVQNEAIERLEVSHDEGYLYLLIVLREEVDLSRETIYIGTDTLQGGNREASELHGKSLDEGLETLIELSSEHSRIRIASNYDFHARMFHEAGMKPLAEKAFQDNSGLFHPWKLVVNYELAHPDSRIDVPFGDIEVGKLHRGITDPHHPEYDSRAMWQLAGNILELRIPWMLLGFSDPSAHTVIDYGERTEGKLPLTTVEGVRIIPWIVRGNTIWGLQGEQPYAVSNLPLYTWDGWQDVDVEYVERPKQSYYMMQEVMRLTEGPVMEPDPLQ